MYKVDSFTHPGQPAHRGHNRPAVAPGSMVWGVRHMGLWFVYGYLTQSAAEEIARKFTGDQPDVGANFREHPPHTVSPLTADEIRR